jgi:hypothetical protein
MEATYSTSSSAWTLFMPCTRAIPSLKTHSQLLLSSSTSVMACWGGIPNGENTSGLGKTGLLLHAADPLFEDGRHLGRGGLRVGGIGSHLLRGVEDGRRGSGLSRQNHQHSARRRSSLTANAAPPSASTPCRCSSNGIAMPSSELQTMAGWRACAIDAGFDGLTDAILPEAEIAATRRLDWRRALENIVCTSRSYSDSSAIN